jgi:ferredoxin
VKLTIDHVACEGHGRCYSLAPALFDCDDEGRPILLVQGPLEPDQEQAARLAVDSCPEYAIAIDQ